MRFFLDHNVPASVAVALQKAGHEVIVQKDAIPTNSADPVVALASAENDAILVTFDKDHKAIANRFGVSNHRLKKLSRIHFRCEYPKAAERLRAGLSFVEFEWRLAQKTNDKRIFLEIQGNGFKTIR
jgi:predicted nuclease of predicted toxin-antitoxin system